MLIVLYPHMYLHLFAHTPFFTNHHKDNERLVETYPPHRHGNHAKCQSPFMHDLYILVGFSFHSRLNLTKTPSEIAEGVDEPLLNCIHNTARAFHLDIPRNALVKGAWNVFHNMFMHVLWYAKEIKKTPKRTRCHPTHLSLHLVYFEKPLCVLT